MEDFENSFTEQPEVLEPQAAAGASFFEKLKTKWPVALGTLGSIVLFAALIFGAYSYGKRGQEVQPTPTVVPAPTSAVTVTPFPTPILTPAVSPAATVSSEGKIAFVRDGDIWVADDDGTDQVNLGTQGKESTISPDKKLVVFTRNSNLFKVNIETKEQTQLTFQGLSETKSAYGVSATNLSWSPNGNFVSYTLGIQRCIGICPEKKRDPENINEGIWVVDVNSQKTKFLVPKTKIKDSSVHETYTLWLPSSDKLIFRATGGEQEQFNIGHLNTVDVKTGEIDEFEIKYGGGLSWSKDGKTMVYYTLKPWKDELTGYYSSPILDKIYMVKNGESKIVFDNDGTQGIFYDDTTVNRPLISPNGSDLFFENGPNSLGNLYSFAVMELNSLVVRQLNLRSEGHGFFLLGWSSDSMRLIFNVQGKVEEDTLLSLWTVNFDGTNLRQIIKL